MEKCSSENVLIIDDSLEPEWNKISMTNPKSILDVVSYKSPVFGSSNLEGSFVLCDKKQHNGFAEAIRLSY
jgi:hypothetical protein